MTDVNFKEEVAVIFLDQLNDIFNAEVSVDDFNEIQHLPEDELDGSLQSKFGDSLKGKMLSFKYDEEYEKIKNEVKVNILESNIIEYKDIMIQAQEQLLTRGQKVEILNEKAEKLKDNANVFYKSSKNVSKKVLCNKKFIIITSIIVFLIIGYAVAAIACHGFLLDNCIKSDS